MNTVQKADRSQDLRAALGLPHQPADFYAHDLSAYTTLPNRALLADAAHDYVMGAATASLTPDMQVWEREKIVTAAQSKLKDVLRWSNLDAALATLIPGAVWYEIESAGRNVQMIVHGEAAWVAPCEANGLSPSGFRAKRMAPREAFAAFRQMAAV